MYKKKKKKKKKKEKEDYLFLNSRIQLVDINHILNRRKSFHNFTS